ncbi:MAG: LuxR C-terminal-related transcriptional regulator, partial [Planctomycetaceae bacterium]
MSQEFWNLLKDQPGIGVLIIDRDGVVLFCNQQAREIYYGTDLNPVGLSIEDIEGRAFADERMPLIHKVIGSGHPLVISHIRGGRYVEATVWPMEPVPDRSPRVIAITRRKLRHDENDHENFESRLIDLGPLDVLTRRELEVLTLIGHGVPQKVVASELGVSQRTIERYRTDIARKLKVQSIAEIAKMVQSSGIRIE